LSDHLLFENAADVSTACSLLCGATQDCTMSTFNQGSRSCRGHRKIMSSEVISEPQSGTRAFKLASEGMLAFCSNFPRTFYFCLTLSPPDVKTQGFSQCQAFQRRVRSSHTLVN
jgi:hypothetical protein